MKYGHAGGVASTTRGIWPSILPLAAAADVDFFSGTVQGMD